MFDDNHPSWNQIRKLGINTCEAGFPIYYSLGIGPDIPITISDGDNQNSHFIIFVLTM